MCKIGDFVFVGECVVDGVVNRQYACFPVSEEVVDVEVYDFIASVKKKYPVEVYKVKYKDKLLLVTIYVRVQTY